MSDFDKHVLDLFGATPQSLGDSLMWALVDRSPDFWSGMPLKADARQLWKELGPYQPTFLTGCPMTGYHRAAANKVKWVERHFGKHPVITCLSREKPFFMEQDGDVLLDDNARNVREWREAKGVGILHRTAAQSMPLVHRAMSTT